MSEFKGMTGRWVTTKDGRKVFISDNAKSYSDIKKTGKEVAHFQDEMYGRRGTVYDLGNKKYALLDDQNEKVVEVRDGTDDGWVHRYIRDVRMHKINHSDRTAVNYSKEYDPNSNKTEDLVDKQEREIAEQQAKSAELNKDRKPPVDTATSNEATTLAKEAVGNLVEFQTEFERDEQSGISGEQSASDILSEEFNKEEVDKIMSGKFDYQLACRTLAELARRETSGNITDEKIAKMLRDTYDVNPSPALLKDVMLQVDRQNSVVPADKVNSLKKDLAKFEGTTTTFGKIRDSISKWSKDNGISKKVPIHGYEITKFDKDGGVEEERPLSAQDVNYWTDDSYSVYTVIADRDGAHIYCGELPEENPFDDDFKKNGWHR